MRQERSGPRRDVLRHCRLAALLALAAAPALAQSPFVHRWGPRDGLVQYSVSTIVQDAAGYIWLGTESGASRFNGRTFDTFDTSNGFENDPVRSIVATPTGVWLLSEAGECFRASGSRAERLPFRERLFGLFPDPEHGDPWVLTGRALVRVSGGAAVPVPFSTHDLTDARAPFALVGDALYVGVGRAIYRFRAARVARVAELPEAVAALVALDPSRLGVVLPGELLSLESAGGAPSRILAAPGAHRFHCASSRGERVVLGTTSGALVVLKGAQATVLSKGLPAQAVLAVFVDREGNVWEGLDSGGVAVLPQTPFTSYTTQDGLGAPEVFYLVADRVRGGVWAGTRNGGVAHVRGGEVRPLTERQGLVSNRVRAMKQARDGTIWLGTTSGIAALDPRGALRTFRPACGLSVRFLHEDAEGTMWAGGQDGLLAAIRGGAVRCVDTKALGTGATLTAISRHEGKTWVGTGRGVHELRPDGTFAPAVAPGASVRELVADGSGALWAPTLNEGAWRLFRGAWTRYGEAEGFDTQVRFVEIAPDGAPWFAGDRGIWSFPDPKKTRFSTANGLTSENVYLIRFDAEGRLWVGTNRGLNVLKGRRVVASFTTADGLADDELNANGFTTDAEGQLWFCTMGGVSRLDPNAVHRRGISPLIDLRRVEVNDRAETMPETGALLLPHDRSSLRFNFSCQCFRDPQRVTYQVRLEGFDDAWSRPSPLEWASYPKLPPGKYTFRVRCASGDGGTSQVLSQPVEIVPALWQRRSFHVLAALAGLCALGLVFALRHRQMRERTVELERLVEKRTRELAVAAEEMHRLSITDPLTGVRNRRDFEQRIRQDLAVAARSVARAYGDADRTTTSLSIAILLIDVDHFKRVNDTYGHEAGDSVLRGFAASIQRVIRESDTLFRWGGDEFLLLARQTEPTQVRVLVERIRGAVEVGMSDLGGPSLSVTCSIGYTVYPFSVEAPWTYGWTELVAIADQGLYLAKTRGRNAYVGFCPARTSFSHDELARIRNDAKGAARAGLVNVVSDIPELFEEVALRA